MVTWRIVDDDVKCLHVERILSMTCSGSHLYSCYRFLYFCMNIHLTYSFIYDTRRLMSVWIIHLQYMDSEFWLIFDNHAIQFIFQKKNYNSIHCAKVLNEQEHIKVLWGKYIWNTNNFFFLILVLVWTLKWFVQPVLSNTNYYKPLLSKSHSTHPPPPHSIPLGLCL
jgi:hypothetical protein